MEDKNQIEKLIASFFIEMNDWERFCEKLDNDDSLSFDEIEKQQTAKIKDIFDKYCTGKERKRGRVNNISYGIDGSYNYNADEEKIKEIDIVGKNKAVVLTERSKPMDEQQKYYIKKNKDCWLIDSKEQYSDWNEKWVKVEI